MRLLITADWHINNYKSYNPSVNFRLHQFIKLAHDTVEIAKKQNCKTLVIAGDFIDIPVLAPKIQHVTKRCIDILKEYFDTIYWFTGQHDLDTKGTIEIDDTILSLFCDEKFIYADKTIIEHDGVKIGFQNWSVHQDTSWIEGKVDVLIGHYTKSNLFGQEIDDSKFDLMIHGDIHNSQVIGKFVSICNPIQKDMSSEASGSMIVYDTETRTWDRVMVDEKHEKYLRIEYTRNPDEEGWASSILYKIFKPVEVNASGEVFEVPIPEWSEINELIDSCVDKLDLKDIHREVVAKTQAHQEIDFNFQLRYIDIKGFRSVEDLRVEFQGNDIVLLLGDNGSGKSSIISALHHLFYYDTHFADEKSDFSEDISLQVEYCLFYQGKQYVIKKGDAWGLEIDGTPIGFPSKPKFEAALPDYLPFLNYPDVYFISSSNSNLAGQYSPERRSELLSKFFKFDKVLTYSETALRLRQETGIEYGEVEKEIQSLESVAEYLHQQLQKGEQFDDSEDVDLLQFEIDRLGEDKKKFQAFETWKHAHDLLEVQLATRNRSLDELSAKPLCDIQGLETAVRDNATALADKKTELSNLKKQYQEVIELRKKIIELQGSEEKVSKLLEKLRSNTCPTCGAPLVGETQQKLISENEDERILIQTNYRHSLDRYNKLIKKHEDGTEDKLYFQYHIETLTREVSALEKEREELIALRSANSTRASQIKDVEAKVAELKRKVSESLDRKPEEVTYSIAQDAKIKELQSRIAAIKAYRSKKAEYEAKLAEVDSTKAKLLPIEERMTKLYNYSAMTSATGDIYVEVLGRLSKSFSTDRVRWFVESGTYRRKDYLIFQAQLRVKKKWRYYDSLSSGQKNLVDLDFLSKMLSTRSGLLAADEILKHLDTNNSVEAAELLSKLNVNTLLIATHSISFPTYTQKLLLELDDEGKTKVVGN